VHEIGRVIGSGHGGADRHEARTESLEASLEISRDVSQTLIMDCRREIHGLPSRATHYPLRWCAATFRCVASGQSLGDDEHQDGALDRVVDSRHG